MRRCEKCSLLFEEPTKICRSCGAILEEVAGGTAPAMDTVVDDWLHAETAEARQPLTPIQRIAAASSAANAEWICPKCKETVPPEFETCWNCGTAPEIGENRLTADSSADELANEYVQTDGPRVALHCAACGSAKMIPDVHVCDQGQHSGGQLVVVVYGDPEALRFKDRLYGAVTADICGDCGHMQLRASNPGELYERYVRSRE